MCVADVWNNIVKKQRSVYAIVFEPMCYKH